MFDYENDSFEDKGLFTFYRQQAEIQEQIKTNKKEEKDNNNLTLKHIHKLKNRLYDNSTQFKLYKSTESGPDLREKTNAKKSFEQLNKEFVKKLSLRNQNMVDLSNKNLGEQVVVIRKGRSLKQKSGGKLQKLNKRYQLQEGYFIKQKIFDPLQESLFHYDQIPQRIQKHDDFSLSKRKRVKRNPSLNDKYHKAKHQLQNQLLLNKQTNQKHGSFASARFQKLKKVDVQPQFDQNEVKIHIARHNQMHLAHKRIPPKVLASILKNENQQIIKHLRKQIEKQAEETKAPLTHRNNHSFIEYGSHDYQKSEINTGRLNEKQRRLITILNQFNKKPLTKVFIN